LNRHCLGTGYGLWYADNSVYEQALVTSVIDGDTVELEDGRRVRYLGIDTPELEEYCAVEATARNIELVEGKIVELQIGKRDKDEYGRLLRYVYVDGIFVNAELVAQGYATAYIFNPDERYSQVLVQLEQYAKLRQRGLRQRTSEIYSKVLCMVSQAYNRFKRGSK
jgi:endonuclease YncB( thermonuclease family)